MAAVIISLVCLGFAACDQPNGPDTQLTPITPKNITNVVVRPAAGVTAPTSAIPADEGYNFTNISWETTTDNQAFSGAFAAGGLYTFKATVAPTTGYTLDGMTGTFSHNFGNVSYGNGQLTISFNAVPQEGAQQFTVTINNGGAGATVTGSWYEGETVNVFAGTRVGYAFANWTAVGVTLANAGNSSINFTMPGGNVTLTANWMSTGPETFTVTIVDAPNATGAGSYEAGANVTINAGSRSGYTFVSWSTASAGVNLTNVNSISTTFTMPANNVTITASWNMDNPGEIEVNFSTHTGHDTVNRYAVADGTEWNKIANNPGGTLRLRIVPGNNPTWIAQGMINNQSRSFFPAAEVHDGVGIINVPIIALIGLGREEWPVPTNLLIGLLENCTLQRMVVIPGEATVNIQNIVIPFADGSPVPVAAAAAPTTINANTQYSGNVTWEPELDGLNFAPHQTYTAVIHLNANTQFIFSGVLQDWFTVSGAVSVTNDANSNTVRATFPITGGTADNPAVIVLTELHGITVPSFGVAPQTTSTATHLHFTYQPITWTYVNGSAIGATFGAVDDIQANVILEAHTGYTFDGFNTPIFVYGSDNVTVSPAGTLMEVTIIFPQLEESPNVDKNVLQMQSWWGGGAALLADQNFGIAVEAGTTYELQIQYTYTGGAELVALFMVNPWEDWGSGWDHISNMELKSGPGSVEPSRLVITQAAATWTTTTVHFTATQTRTLYLYFGHGSNSIEKTTVVNYIGVRRVGSDGVGTGNNLFAQGDFENATRQTPGNSYGTTPGTPFQGLHHEDKWWYTTGNAPRPPLWVRTY